MGNENKPMLDSPSLREPGADTGTTPPPDVWTCEACGYKSDDIGEYREVCGKCFSAAAERGTTPPEGLDVASIIEAVYQDLGATGAICMATYARISRWRDVRAATQRALLAAQDNGGGK